MVWSRPRPPRISSSSTPRCGGCTGPIPAGRSSSAFSEGGLVATLAAERYPDLFDGALAGCGPIGDFQAQLNYIGDFRVVFDYLFPGVIPGNAVDIPETVRSSWERAYVPAIVIALAANFDAALELIRITGAPVAGNDLRSVAETTVGILWYDVFGFADAQARLGGQPFDNSTRVYAGSVERRGAECRRAAALGRPGGSWRAWPDSRPPAISRSRSPPCTRPATRSCPSTSRSCMARR